jgi:LSD1 subclass zinc finger protein
MMIAKTILGKKTDKDGGINFAEFMSITEGSAITFDRYLSLVKQTGGDLHRISMVAKEQAMKAYADVEKGIKIEEEPAAATPQPKQPSAPGLYPGQPQVQTVQPQPQPQMVMPRGVIKLMCHSCRRPFGVPAGAKMVACPHCQVRSAPPALSARVSPPHTPWRRSALFAHSLARCEPCCMRARYPRLSTTSRAWVQSPLPPSLCTCETNPCMRLLTMCSGGEQHHPVHLIRRQAHGGDGETSCLAPRLAAPGRSRASEAPRESGSRTIHDTALPTQRHDHVLSCLQSASLVACGYIYANVIASVKEATCGTTEDLRGLLTNPAPCMAH